MKYSVVRCSNGNYSIEQETDDLDSAKITYRNLCNAYQKAPDVVTATAAILNEKLEVIQPYKESFEHEAQAQGE